jgi:tetratricopeptide (TPR) repeat protein
MFPELLLAATLSVRPISDAEHAAVQVAAQYLGQGPDAVAEQLSPDSPLMQFTRPQQRDEIETRLGPRQGAEWELQTVVPALKDKVAAFTVTYPSGWDDQVMFEMTKTPAGWKVRDMRFLAQATTPAVATTQSVPAVKTANALGWVERFTPRSTGPLFALIACAASIAAVFVARNRTLSRALIGTAAVAVALAMIPREQAMQATQASVVPARPDPSLAPLLPMRRAMALGEGDINALHRAVNRSGQRGAVADLWKIHHDLMQTDTTSAREALKRFRTSSDRPLAAILRARLAFLENDEVAAVLAYEEAVSLGPGRDGLWYETAEALSALGFDDRAKRYFERLARMGSRYADVYYTLAMLETDQAGDQHEAAAEKLLRRAWTMQPVERSAIIATGGFWSLIRRPGITGLVNLRSATEPLVLADKACTRPIQVPPDAETRTSGEYLQIDIGTQRLIVPGGAELAPAGTPVVESTAWAQSEQQRALADYDALLGIGTNASAFAQPALRQRIIATTNALADRNRWFDLVRLTDGLNPASEHIPPSLFFLRSIGLQRLDRDPEARQLLAGVAASKVLQRKRDADSYEQLAELFNAHDLFDAAVRMYDKALAIRANPFVDDRVRQIQMNKRLATSYSTLETAHFAIHYPEDVSPQQATQLGGVLERELIRLKRFIPLKQFEPVVVNVVWWQDFRATYTGSDFILGFYNGKITVPFAGVDASHPAVIAILGHELAHAMIAQATNDHAPRWFQEGLAQRVELSQYQQNAFNMYDEERLLPVPLLDAVLRNSPDPEMISAAYIIAQTNVQFLESRYGRGAIVRMMEAYREGGTTEEAIRRASGKSIAEYEMDLRDWGAHDRRVFENTAADLGVSQ